MNRESQLQPAATLGGVAHSFVLLAIAMVIGQAIGFVALMIVTRRVGPTNVGAYNFAASITRFFAIPANLGITTLAIRDVARQNELARQIAGKVLALRLGLFAMCYVALLALSSVLTNDDLVRTLLPIAGFFCLADVVSLAWGLQALQRFLAVAVIGVLGQLVYGSLVVPFVPEGRPGIIAYAWLNVVGAMVTAGGCWIWFVRCAGWPVVPRLSREVRELFTRSLPFGMSLIMIQVYYSLDSVILGYLRSTYEVGQYGVGYKIVSAVLAFAGVWVSVIFPHASRLYGSDPAHLGRDVGKAVTLSMVIAIPTGLGGLLVATPLMAALFGAPFAPAGQPFAVLIWSASIVLVSVNFGNVLMACDGERSYLWGVTLGAIVNTVLNFVLIPPFGAVGAAAATVATELLVMAYMIRQLSQRVPLTWPDMGRLARTLLAAGVMGGVVAIVVRLTNVWAAVMLGVGVYSALVMLFRVVRPSEISVLLRPGTEQGADV